MCIRDSVNVVDVLENMVSDPGGLQSLLDRLFYPERELRIDCIYRCYYWLAFAGFKLDDVFKINIADVDLESMVVHFEDEEYPIYKEALPAFKNASTLNAFNAYSTWFTEVKSWNRVCLLYTSLRTRSECRALILLSIWAKQALLVFRLYLS